MAYTAFGPDGPRVAFAISDDAYRWERLGLVRFAGTANVVGDDKDAAFFPRAGDLAERRAQPRLLPPSHAPSFERRRPRGDSDDRAHAIRRSRIDSHRVRSAGTGR